MVTIAAIAGTDLRGLRPSLFYARALCGALSSCLAPPPDRMLVLTATGEGHGNQFRTTGSSALCREVGAVWLSQSYRLRHVAGVSCICVFEPRNERRNQCDG
jgi:hypothetical protein